MADTAVRCVPSKPGERSKPCSACTRNARTLYWLQHVETELPLTMPLCSDCFHDAAKQIERTLTTEVKSE